MAPVSEEPHPLCHEEMGVSRSGSGIQCNYHLCHVGIKFKMRLHYTLWPPETPHRMGTLVVFGPKPLLKGRPFKARSGLVEALRI